MTRRLSRWSLPVLLPVLLLGACAIPDTVHALSDDSPPPEFGRPGWVRGCAGIGGWIGGLTGGVVSILFLPVTYPLSLLADDGLGEHGSSEFILFPAVTMAAFGHSFFGWPPDMLDYVFRRAWVGWQDPVARYDFMPLEGPEVPKAVPAAGEGVESGGGDAPR